jgi:O-antigen ligase
MLVFPPALFQEAYKWLDTVAKLVLLFFGIALWYRGWSYYAYYLLTLTWILDGGLFRLRRAINEPLIIAILALCIVVGLGIFWSDDTKLGVKVWRKHFTFLIFIPYASLLNTKRLPWALAGVIIGFLGALIIGVHEWLVMGVQGLPMLGMSYVAFSSCIGIAILGILYLAAISDSRRIKILLWIFALFLLFVQFNQHARSALVATLLSSAILLFLLYKARARILLGIIASSIVVVTVLAYSSANFQQRIMNVKTDIEFLKLGNYSTSLGYRIAIWDIGLDGLAKRPLLGYGTGMANSYFDNSLLTYKGGMYSELRGFEGGVTHHYHNDWLELGMQVGALGILAYAYLLFSWFKALQTRRRPELGVALVCFIFLSGLTDNFIAHRQVVYLLLTVTAIAITDRRRHTDGEINGR